MSNKALFGFASGLALGSYLTYVILKDSFDKKARKEIAEMRKHYTDKIMELAMRPDGNKSDKKAEEQKDTFETTPSFDIKKDFKDDMEKYKDYTSLYSKKKNLVPDEVSMPVSEALVEDDYIPEDEESEEDEDDDDYTDHLPTYPREGPAEKPYSITPEQFANEYPYWDKTTLLYYWEDEACLTDFENEVVDIDINLVKASMGEYERDVAYIRNEALNTDYEILKTDGHYSNI